MTPSGPDPGAAALSVSGLSKSYRVGHIRGSRRMALEGLSLEVLRGEVFGYLGPNGAGKTTTLKVLTGIVAPDAGTATILGLELRDRRWRFRTGYLPESPYLYDYLTAREYLDYVGRLFALPQPMRRDRARELLQRVDLTHAADWPLRRYSKGMLQRAGLAQALMNDPELVFLDEPMSGLDPIGRCLVRDIILDLKKAGKTVFFSTHILPDAEALCDRVALLRAGRLVDVGPLNELLRLDASHLEVLVTAVEASALDRLGGQVTARHALGERWRLEVPERSLGAVITALEQEGGRVLGVSPVRQSLEEYFFKEMGARGGETA